MKCQSYYQTGSITFSTCVLNVTLVCLFRVWFLFGERNCENASKTFLFCCGLFVFK